MKKLKFCELSETMKKVAVEVYGEEARAENAIFHVLGDTILMMSRG